jgi:hypothetical protein
VTAPTAEGRRRGGPPAWFALIAVGSLVLAVVLIALQALGIGVGPAGPAPTIAPAGQAAQYTHDLVTQTLSGAGFQVTDPQTPYRPGESPALINVPRRVTQAILPSDPDKGYVVIYELPSNGEAERLGKDFAAYLATGPGAIQYPRDEQFVLRRVGPTLVFFSYSPLVSPDPEMARLASTVATIGEPIAPG